jgi:DNA polymerase I
MLVFDLETNGFLEDLTTIHCLVIKDTFTGVPYVCRGDTVRGGAMRLMEATQQGVCIAGHNILKFDIPAIQKLFPWFQPDMRYVLDTMVLGRLIWPDLKDQDRKLIKQGRMPTAAKFKPHALETWGYRLKLLKDEYSGDPEIIDPEERKKRKWERWNQTMEDYCVQDVEVTDVLLWRCFDAILAKGFSAESVNLEHHVARIIARQERYGFAFDEEAAGKLYAHLAGERSRLEVELAQQYGSFYVSRGLITTKKSARYQVEELGIAGYDKKTGAPIYKRMEFTEGVQYTKLELLQFNPGSRDHIANRLKTLYGWEPVEFTDDGKPKVDEQVLAGLTFPGIEGLKKYLMVEKRIGQLAEGKEAWLKHVKNGRIHGSINTNGAVTGRMTHSKPNVSQVPANRAPYGEDCRRLFVASRGKTLVGADADALELRDLAGYMARFDEGAYIKTVLEGKKEDGTDMHSVNCRALGMDPKSNPFGDKETGRDVAKTWFYAFIYGAGDEKLGSILTHKKGPAAVKRGKKSRADFMRNLPALGKLVERVKSAVKTRGRLIGLDGRVLEARSMHSALNTLLQSAGAVQMKKALCLLDDNLQSMGLIPGQHYEFVANVHDEWQIECDEDKGEVIGKAAVEAIVKAGEHFNFRCPLGGAWGIGRTWAETH